MGLLGRLTAPVRGPLPEVAISAFLGVVVRRRRVWTGNGRAHIELRVVQGQALPAFADALAATLRDHPAVQWAEVYPPLGRVVAAYDGDVASVSGLVAVVEQVEAEHGVDGAPFGIDPARPDPGRPDQPGHPADTEPLIAGLASLGADVLSVGLGAAGRAARLLPLHRLTPFAVLTALVEGTPRLRGLVAKLVGPQLAGFGLSVANAFVQGLTQGPVGPVVNVAHRSGQVAESFARHRVWVEREPELHTKPPEPAPRRSTPRPRPAPLPAGPVERYSDRALPLSLAAGAASLALPNRAERASAALYAGLPKAAIMGRDAFAGQLGRALAARGVIAHDPGVLRLLDRVDCVVIAGGLVAGEAGVSAEGRELLDAAREAQLHLSLATGDRKLAADARADAVLPDGPELADAIREIQADGHGVMLVGGGSCEGMDAADCAVGVVRPLEPVPWDADLLCGSSLADAALIVEACAAARDVSRQSAQLAAAGAGVGAFFTFSGRVPGATQRVMLATNTAALASLANGVRAGLDLGRRPRPVPRDPTPWHALEVDEAIERLGSSRAGLSAGRAADRRTPPPRPSPLPVRLGRATFDELANPLTPLLVGGAGLSLVVGSVADAAMVGSVVALNAVIGGAQRLRSEQAAAELDGGHVGPVTVLRDGGEHAVAAADLVPGDLIRLKAGDAVPADCRIVEAAALEVDESNLTGESLPVPKAPEPSDAAALADRRSMLYEASSIAVGEATAVVVAVGPATEARRASQTAHSGESDTGVEARLSTLTSLTAPIALLSAVGVVGAGLVRSQPPRELVGSGVSLAVASVPEGLPVLSTLAQVAAARRLAERGAVVTDPRAIEALGRVDVLCADKTGTLTEGRIRVACVSDGRTDEDVDALRGPRRGILAAGLRASPEPLEEGRLPHPTDQALVEGGARAGVAQDEGAAGWRRVAELPFEPARGYHAVAGRDEKGGLLSVKGAPELVLPRCTRRRGPRGGIARLGEDGRRRLGEEIDRLARRGLRILAVAERRLEEAVADEVTDEHVDDLVFAGFVAYADPVRPTAAAAIDDLRKAGVEVVMITGDHPSTAEGIAVELGLLNGEGMLTGPQLDELDDEALAERVGRVSVYARVTPTHKVRIVEALQRAGRVVAMAGDGANDAPAIRLADVGVALGKRATPAAREAADVTVVEERIETVVDAIEEGRAMWVSVRDAVAILIGGNLGEIGFTVGASLLGGGPPLNARQLLLVNLLTDVAPAMTIALRPPERTTGEQLLREGPEASLGEALNRAIAWRAVVTATGAGAAWLAARGTGTPARARTVALVALVGTQLGQTLVAGGRSPAVIAASVGSAALLAGAVQTPGVSHLLGNRPLGPVGWATAAVAAAGATAGSLVLQPAFDRFADRVGPQLGATVAPRLARLLPGTG